MVQSSYTAVLSSRLPAYMTAGMKSARTSTLSESQLESLMTEELEVMSADEVLGLLDSGQMSDRFDLIFVVCFVFMSTLHKHNFNCV